MVFSSVTFVLVFLPLFLLIYLLLYALCRICNFSLFLCNTFLFGASLVFYAWGEPEYVLILLLSLLVNFCTGIWVYKIAERTKKSNIRKNIVLSVGIILNIALLAYFKYMNFFIDNGVLVLANAVLPRSLAFTSVPTIVLPLGISFYTFQGLSYILDVYRGELAASRNIINFGCYLTMFPQLVAGPIVRYISIAHELISRRLTVENFSQGIQRFVIGLAKKLLIADTLGRVADAAFNLPVSELSPLAAWAGIVCYSLQIYYDFSGYSDMAIGMGKMLGFTFPENFNYPYISKNIQEFWRRWHMTLSAWFRDYVYIPLGGNRHGPIRTSVNLWIVFALCGFWHGAGWVFLAWGLYHGTFLVIERLFPRFFAALPRYVLHVYTIAVFMGGWVIFCAKDMEHALQYFKGLAGFWELGVQTNRVWVELFAYDVYIALVVGIIGAMPVFPRACQWWETFNKQLNPHVVFVCDSLGLGGVLLLLGVCLMPLFGATYNAFIYFRF